MSNPTARQRAEELFRQAQESKQVLSALRLAEEAAAADPTLPGVNGMRAECLARMGRIHEALIVVDLEIDNAVNAEPAKQLRQDLLSMKAQHDAHSQHERQWASVLTPAMIHPIEMATHRYHYRGHAMIKNPFDMALYPMLLWNLKPATIFEIGSYNGTSALWMADQMATYGVDTQVHSLDIVAVTAIQHPNVHFYAGSGRDLDKVFPADFIESCPRPFLVIEDADHTYETSIAVLNHFHPHMRLDEYFVIEDGLTSDGPRNAITEFIPAHPEYAVDSYYCDFFGYNSTWCINGFIKRVG